MAIHESTKPKLNAILPFIQATESKKFFFVITGTDPIHCSETCSWISPLSHKLYFLKEENWFWHC